MEILVDSIHLYLYCVISIKLFTSGDVYNAQKCTSFFCASEVQECARAIAITASKFQPEAVNQLISAHEIVEFLCGLPDNKVSTFRIDIDSLKKAFSSQIIRDALKTKFLHKFQFIRSATSWDIITTGPSAFKKGYSIIYTAKVEQSSTIRFDIEDMCQYICSYYKRQQDRLKDTAQSNIMTLSTLLGATESMEMNIPMDIGATPVRYISNIERVEDRPKK